MDERDGPVPGDELLAEVLGFLLAGRPERIEEGWLALAPPPFRAAARDVREVLGAIGSATVETPSAGLRDRLLASAARHRPRRALLVVDMINDHLDPGTLLEVPRARDVVPALQARLEDARRRGIPVVYIVDEHDPDDPDLDAWGTHAVRGTEGNAIWAPLAPAPGDLVVKKASYSAFFRSSLAEELDRLGVDTLVLTGCMTEIGLMATATDAMQQGFVVEIPPDAQAGSSAEAEQAALGIVHVMAPFGPARKARLERLAA